MTEDRSKPPEGYSVFTDFEGDPDPGSWGASADFGANEFEHRDGAVAACWAHRDPIWRDGYEQGRKAERLEAMCIHGEEGALRDHTICSVCVDDFDVRLREQQALGIEMALKLGCEACGILMAECGRCHGMRDLADRVRRGE